MAPFFAQAGAIPFRLIDNSIQVLLISTSSGKHFTIPKGLIDPGYTATQTALNEAYEEAGIEGHLLRPSVGSYAFEKWGGRCEVEVFAMAVRRELDDWPERLMRKRVWTEFEHAARQVKHAELGILIRKLSSMLNVSATAG